MKTIIFKLSVVLPLLAAFALLPAQDIIYQRGGNVIKAKVTEVTSKEVRFTKPHIPNTPTFILRTGEIDSIMFEGGVVEEMAGSLKAKKYRQNIPYLNTWVCDLSGLGYLSVSQSYERRLKNGKVGFRVPLYIGFNGASIAGIGMFLPHHGPYMLQDYFETPYYFTGYDSVPFMLRTFSIAIGINPRMYLFKHRKVRAFVGPEIDIGYLSYGYKQPLVHNPNEPLPPDTKQHYCGTIAALANFGVSINPKDRFNLAAFGAVGAGHVFSGSNPIGWTGVWQIGVSIGTNF